MGVKGLWKLLEPSGRPVTLESLEGKVLGVDVSLWLNQSVKGIRDIHGNAVPNAHLLGLFNRICKLLFYRIKPVFVFDGGVPQLKKQTLAARRQRLNKAVKESNRARDRLLKNYLKKQAMSTVLGDDVASSSTARQQRSKDTDLYELPPLDPSQEADLSSDSQNDSWEERQLQQEVIHENFQNLDSIDVLSDDFKALPAEIQHEIILELKENRKRSSWSTIGLLPKKAHDFSNYQLSNLLQKSRMSQRLEDVRKEMSNRESGEIASMLNYEGATKDVQSQRVVSEDTQHYILIKGLGKKKDFEEQRPESLQGTLQGAPLDDMQAKRRMNATNATTTKAESFDDVIHIGDDVVNIGDDVINIGDDVIHIDDDDIMVQNLELHRVSKQDKASGSNDSLQCKTDGAIIIIDDVEKEGSIATCRDKKRMIDEVDLTGDEEEQPSKMMKRDIRTDGQFIESDREMDDDVVEVKGAYTDIAGQGNNDVIISSVVQGSATLPSAIQNAAKENKLQIDAMKSVTVSNDRVTHQVWNMFTNSSSIFIVDDFIEITFDPSKVTAEDELFPADVFTQAGSDKEESPASSQSDVVDITTQYQKLYDVRREDSDDIIVVETEEKTNLGVTKEEENVEIDVEEIFEESDDEIESADIELPAPVTQWASKTMEDLEAMKIELESESQILQAEKNKQERFGSSITDQMYVEAQELLKLFGLPYLISLQEAEAQCAYLDMCKLTNGTVTDDSDIWLFGGTRVYKNMFNKRKYVEFYAIDGINKQLLLSRDKMIQLAYLVGSDYTEGIAGVGGVTALEVLHEFQGEELEGLQAFREWWEEAQTEVDPPTETKLKSKLRTVNVKPGFPNPTVRQAYLNPAVDESKETFQWGIPDLHELREFAKEKFGWSRMKVDELLLPVMKKVTEKNTQPKISSYFPSEFSQPREIKSKRVKRVINRLLRGDNLAENQTDTHRNGKNKMKRGQEPKLSDKADEESENVGRESGSESESESSSKEHSPASKLSKATARVVKKSLQGSKGKSTLGGVGSKKTKGKAIPGKSLKKTRKQENSGNSEKSTKNGKVVNEIKLSESSSSDSE
ncbi:DNA excision repair protein ERCC-5-like [Ptychodera flava]|uniref:DNA excision repair protein ERCC-5-like n=1 Tax=Ptychodera flava TaxID=63121 RepID=UPI003969F282